MTKNNVASGWLADVLSAPLVVTGPRFLLLLNLSGDDIIDTPVAERAMQFDYDGIFDLAVQLEELAWPGSSFLALQSRFEAQWPIFSQHIEDIQAMGRYEAMVTSRSSSELGNRPTPTASAGPLKGGHAPMKIFIGSSGERIGYADEVQRHFDYTDKPTVWNQNFFSPSNTTIEDLTDKAPGFDFAIFVLTPDDEVMKRGIVSKAARDNLIFELGLFMGALGRGRTFVLHPRGEALDLPTDLLGVTKVDFRVDPQNILAGLGAACTRIRSRMRELGPKHPLKGP